VKVGDRLLNIDSPEAGRFLWKNSQEGFALLNQQGIIQDANPALCALLGYTREELVGKHFTEITSSEDAKADSLKFTQLIEKSIKSYNMQKRWRAKFGQEVPGKLHVKMWFDDVLVWGSVVPYDPYARALLGDVDAEKLLNERLGESLRNVPNFLIKHWKPLLLIFGVISGTISFDFIKSKL